MRKALALLALLAVLVATSCTWEEAAIGIVDIVVEAKADKKLQEEEAKYPLLYFGEPRPQESTTSEPATEVCLVYLTRKPEIFTVDVVVKNTANGFETVVHLQNFDATVAEVRRCTQESIPLEPGVNKIRAHARGGGKAVVVITRVAGECGGEERIRQYCEDEQQDGVN